MAEKIRVHPDYTLRLVDLMRPVEIAEDFTLGDLCRILESCEEIDLETLSALVHCPLEPLIEDCLRPTETEDEPATELHAIELTWLCESDLPGEDDALPTWLALDVDGVGEIWEDHRSGGRFHEEGRDLSRCNRYAIELTPLYALRDLPLRLAPVMHVRPSPGREAESGELEIAAPETRLLQLLYALFWELSFFGTPEERDAERRELRERVRRIDSGEERSIPHEEVMKRLDSDRADGA